MRLNEGILGLLYSLSLIIFSVLFFDYTVSYDRFLLVILLVIAIIIAIPALKIILNFLKYKRVTKKGIKIKAKVIKVRRSIIGFKHSPKYILEVSYIHPKNNKSYQTRINYYEMIDLSNSIQENDIVSIYIDPKNPAIVLLA
jgi:hypothetical protein